MSDASAVFSIVLILSAIHTGDGPAAISAPPADPEQAIAAIERCMEQTPAPWPNEWRGEYVDTIRQAIAADPNALPTAWHLAVLEQGFALYWDSLAKSQDRPFFEVQCAEIRWYVERLMATALPSEDLQRQLHDQYQTLWDHAASSLLAQFPFLDPNIVCKACADHLQRCLRWVDAPLKPIFRQRFAPDQMDRIREGWHELRYARVDLMRQLGGEDGFLASNPRETALAAHPDYLLTCRSLEQLESFIWTIVTRPPDDYIQAQQDYLKAQRRRQQRVLAARAQEQRLKTERFKQLRQTEYLGFLLAIVLESAQQLGSPPAGEVSESSHSRVEAAPWKEVMPMR